jgi:hypothetical protein
MVASTSFATKMAVIKTSSFIASADPPSSVAVGSTFVTIMAIVVVAFAPVVVLEEPNFRLGSELVFVLRFSFYLRPNHRQQST